LKASSPVRSPSNEVWKKIIDIVLNDGHKIIITDAKHGDDIINHFIDSLDPKYKNKDIFNFAPHSETLDSTIALCSLAKLAIATDSALIHIAASVGIPVLGIYGPFPGEIRMSTYKNCEWVNCKRECAPCFLHSQTPCRNSKDGYSLCYENLDLNEFKSKLDKIMKG
jgi:ADP-heptose:LPS heptosyltransferase